MLNLAGLIFKPDLSEGPVRDAIKNTLGCMLPFYPFYYFAKKEELKAIHLIRFALLILPIIIFRYFTNKSEVLLIQNPDNTDVVNNFSYMFVSISHKKKETVSSAFNVVDNYVCHPGSKARSNNYRFNRAIYVFLLPDKDN
jgi:hypothetical protein